MKKISVRITYVCKINGKIYATGDSSGEASSLGLEEYKKEHGDYPTDKASVCIYRWW